MKKLLATTAILMSFAGAASAQSVLERILSKVNNDTNLASVNGTFANIAENIGGSTTVFNNGSTTLTAVEYNALAAAPVEEDYTVVATGDAVNTSTGAVISAAAYLLLGAEVKGSYAVAGASAYFTGADGVAILASTKTALPSQAEQNAAIAAYEAVTIGGIEGINGSINNVINGLDTATMVASVGAVTAVEFLLPTVDLGNISSTVLGAVNTGEITLGVNQSVDQAKTSTTGALSSVIDQIGGSADTGALVLNIASNMTGVNGSINNTMTGVNGSVGTASTTVLGAVNTGKIVSGVNAAVTGIVGGTTQTSPSGL
jgi:ribosomal protein L30E